jgi:acetylornithine/succinyldiaminopimelate/putrescine aminotransferase
MEQLQKLHEMRKNTGSSKTTGLTDDVINKFLASDSKLGLAIDEAFNLYSEIKKNDSGLLKLPEADLIVKLQSNIVNFYPDNQTNPYVAAGARGPWLVSVHGAVIHDSGGYGMLGFGHAPQEILDVMAKPHVMANIMTAAYAQKRIVDKLKTSIGSKRGSAPYNDFIFMNSGSEAVTVACRISDLHAKNMTDPGGKHAGKRIMFLSLKGSFHGRTDRPAQLSSSTMAKYQNLASFRDRDNLKEVLVNNVDSLKEAFDWAKKENIFIEAMFMEPVMGEGDPGMAITPEFFNAARELTKANDSLLVIDSIQAAIRTQGCLSITDYPGFEKCDAPDMETYSKALNGGQYPLSVLALREETAKIYLRGVYGNTMTSNPRALEVACTVMEMLTPEISKNIVDRGAEFLEKFEGLRKEFPDVVTKIQGTGLLFSLEVDSSIFDVVGFGALEEYMRVKGIGVIHGGENSLRFTPHFEISSEEIDLVCDVIRDAFKNGPRKK